MPKFDLAGHRKIWFLISALIIIPGIICMFVRGFNFGIDFTGGTIIDLKFAQPVTIAEVRTSLAKYGLDGSTIQLSGAQSDVTSSEDDGSRGGTAQGSHGDAQAGRRRLYGAA